MNLFKRQGPFDAIAEAIPGAVIGYDVKTQPVIAYRSWRHDYRGSLVSMSQDTVWAPRTRATAVCPKHSGGPRADCNCGIHAFKDVQSLFRSYGDDALRGGVLGRVALWGKVQVHENGYRAEFAYPQLLFSVPYCERVDHLANTYGIESGPVSEEAQPWVGYVVDQALTRRFHDSWDSFIQYRTQDGIPILDLEKIVVRENERREFESQQRGYGIGVQYWSSGNYSIGVH